MDEETRETDAQEFDCETCPVALAFEGLWPENRAAWGLSRRLLTRFTVDLHALPIALDRATRDLPAEDFLDLLDRLTMIYDALAPPPPPVREP